MHKTGNILDKLPKNIQSRAKENLHQIWMAETKENAEKAFDHFIASYEAKYPKATECLAKDRKVLLTFYDFPAEHWLHLRTTNPIESTFATVRLRTTKTRGMLTRDTMLTMVFKLSMSAQKRWRRLNRPERLGELNSRNQICWYQTRKRCLTKCQNTTSETISPRRGWAICRPGTFAF